MTKFLLHIPLLVGLLLFPVLGWADYQAGLDAQGPSLVGDTTRCQTQIRTKRTF